MNYNNIVYKEVNNIGHIIINRPDKLNALNKETLTELDNLFDKLKSNSIKVVVVSGAGEKAFVAGADIKEINTLDGKSGEEFARFGQTVFNKIEQLGKPVIAAVNGFALGGGCELAMACHIRIASQNAKFGQPEIKLGIIPGYGGTQRLPRLIGMPRAIEYSLTGEMIDAETAERIGLVNKVVTESELTSSAFELADKISGYSSIVIKNLLDSILGGFGKPIEDGLQLEAEQFGKCCTTEDFKEGTSAFLEKRKPEFKNQ